MLRKTLTPTLEHRYFNLMWSDQDTSDRCLNFSVVDDSIVEGDEVICVHIVQVEGTAQFSETGNTYALLTVNDNDKASDYTLILSLSIVAFVLVGLGTSAYIRRQRMISKYIKIRYAVEVSTCRYTSSLP